MELFLVLVLVEPIQGLSTCHVLVHSVFLSVLFFQLVLQFVNPLAYFFPFVNYLEFFRNRLRLVNYKHFLVLPGRRESLVVLTTMSFLPFFPFLNEVFLFFIVVMSGCNCIVIHLFILPYIDFFPGDFLFSFLFILVILAILVRYHVEIPVLEFLSCFRLLQIST